MPRFLLILLGVAAIAASTPAQLRADFLMGKELRYEFLTPDKNTVRLNSKTDFTVVPVGDSGSPEIADFGYSDNANFGTIDVRDNSIFVDFTGASTAPDNSFTGFHFFDFNDEIADFGAFTIVQDTVGVDLSFDANNLYVNGSGKSFAATDVIELRVAAVPEPTSLLLFSLVATVMGAGALYKRRLAMTPV